MVLERAATALTLNRLLEQQQDPMELQAHRTTLADIIDRRFESSDDIHARTAALGVPTARRELVAVVVELSADRAHQPHARPRDLEAELVASALRSADVKALVGSLRPGRVGVLLPLPEGADASVLLTRVAQHVLAKADSANVSRPVIGVGSWVRDLDAVRRSFAEAAHAAEAAQGSPEVKPYYELPDVQLRGLLYVLGGDPRLQAFVERTLGPLLDHDAKNGTDLVGALQIYLTHGRNKSAAADAAHLSRQAFYQRLTTIEKVLGVDLDSAEACTSLHAAVMAYEALRPPDPMPPVAATFADTGAVAWSPSSCGRGTVIIRRVLRAPWWWPPTAMSCWGAPATRRCSSRRSRPRWGGRDRRRRRHLAGRRPRRAGSAP